MKEERIEFRIEQSKKEKLKKLSYSKYGKENISKFLNDIIDDL